MADLKLPLFQNGIDTISPPTALEAGYCVDAVDLIINRQGEIENRPGKRRLMTSAGMHSLYGSRSTGISLVVKDGNLCRARYYDGALVCTVVNDLSLGPNHPITPAGNVSYTEMDGGIWATDGSSLWCIVPDGNGAKGILATLPVPLVSAVAGSGGGLPRGQYAVGVSFIATNFEESALSPLQFVNVEDNGAVSVMVQWPNPRGRVATAQLYLSSANGETVHRVKTLFPTGSSDTVSLGITDQLGKIAATRNKQPMPAGSIIRAWRGHLFTVQGPVVYWSDPMYYGLHDPRANFIQFGSDITMLEPVEGGLFVGTAQEVSFLSGSRPGEWTRRLTGAAPPFQGCSTTIPANEFVGSIGNTAMPIAVWLSNQGITLGMPDGSINEVQSGRLRLPDWASGTLGWHNRRVWASVA